MVVDKKLSFSLYYNTYNSSLQEISQMRAIAPIAPLL